MLNQYASQTTRANNDNSENKCQELLGHIPADYFLTQDSFSKLLQNYSDAERMAIFQDLALLRTKILSSKPKSQALGQKQSYVATAGGPASGKSYLIEALHRQDPNQAAIAYIDPDRSCLFHMPNTYLLSRAEGLSPEKAYHQWRNASNFIAQYLLMLAIKNHQPIFHGTTSTSAELANFWAYLKRQNYALKLVHVTCEEVVREQSFELRQARGEFQCSKLDFSQKNKQFFDKLPFYLENVDQIDFYYRSNHPEQKALLCASKSLHAPIKVLKEHEALYQQLLETQARGANQERAVLESYLAEQGLTEHSHRSNFKR